MTTLDGRLRALEVAARAPCRLCNGAPPAGLVIERADGTEEIDRAPTPCAACGQPPFTIRFVEATEAA